MKGKRIEKRGRKKKKGLEKEWKVEDSKEVGRQEVRRETEAEGEDAEP